jgi:hypothetical protein
MVATFKVIAVAGSVLVASCAADHDHEHVHEPYGYEPKPYEPTCFPAYATGKHIRRFGTHKNKGEAVTFVNFKSKYGKTIYGALEDPLAKEAYGTFEVSEEHNKYDFNVHLHEDLIHSGCKVENVRFAPVKFNPRKVHAQHFVNNNQFKGHVFDYVNDPYSHADSLTAVYHHKGYKWCPNSYYASPGKYDAAPAKYDGGYDNYNTKYDGGYDNHQVSKYNQHHLPKWCGHKHTWVVLRVEICCPYVEEEKYVPEPYVEEKYVPEPYVKEKYVAKPYEHNPYEAKPYYEHKH